MPMDLIKRDPINFQTSQAPLKGFYRPLGAAVFIGLTLSIPTDAELCGNHHIISVPTQGSGKNFFGMAESIDIGGIEKVDAQIKRLLNRANRFPIIHPAVAMPSDWP